MDITSGNTNREERSGFKIHSRVRQTGCDSLGWDVRQRQREEERMIPRVEAQEDKAWGCCEEVWSRKEPVGHRCGGQKAVTTQNHGPRELDIQLRCTDEAIPCRERRRKLGKLIQGSRNGPWIRGNQWTVLLQIEATCFKNKVISVLNTIEWSHEMKLD